MAQNLLIICQSIFYRLGPYQVRTIEINLIVVGVDWLCSVVKKKKRRLNAMKQVLFLVAVIMFVISNQAFADYSFNFMSTDGKYGVQGTLLTETIGNGLLSVIGGSVVGDGTLNSDVQYNLLSAGNHRAAGGDVLSSDNKLTPGSSIFLTDYGLVFKSNSSDIWINIWGNTNDYTYFQSGPTSWYAVKDGTASISPVPLPASFLLLAPALLGLIGVRRFRK
jgi:hypothetical protein